MRHIVHLQSLSARVKTAWHVISPQAPGHLRASSPRPGQELQIEQAYTQGPWRNETSMGDWTALLFSSGPESRKPQVKRIICVQCRKRCQRKSALNTSCGQGLAASATQMLPTTDRCPSQQHCDHTQQPNQALAALHPGNYTLGSKPASSSRGGLGRALGEQEELCLCSSNSRGMSDDCMAF